MKTVLRTAVANDAPHFIEIKNQLSFKFVNGKTTTGGFLLGTDIDTYKQYIEKDYCLVVEKEIEKEIKIIGFGIVLKNKNLKEAEIWTKRNSATWNINIKDYEQKQVCYFEQLAFIKGYSREVLKLCFNIMSWAYETHSSMITTTVKEPIVNLAAVPYILKAGGQKVGNIKEKYPKIGKINSGIYLIEKEDFIHYTNNSNFSLFFQQNLMKF
jgi:hypothetical protein